MEDDTVKLLRECNAGVKMGIKSIDDVSDHVRDGQLLDILQKSKTEHEKLECETEKLLEKGNDDGKEPAAMAKFMSWVKCNVKLTGEDSDRVVADLITDGCNMGVKSLYRYLHQYKDADDESKDIVMRTIKEEKNLADDMHKYL